MTSTIILVLAVFGATCVEAVEALTLVVASGTTRGWRSAFEGAASALVLLAVLVAAIGVPLVHYVPIDVLRVVIGGLLLVLGLGWLRKSILRASGHKALHDEDLIYANTVAELGTGEANRFLKGVQGKWPKAWSQRVKQSIDQAVLATSASPGSAPSAPGGEP